MTKRRQYLLNIATKASFYAITISVVTLITWFIEWSVHHTSDFQPYTGSFVEYVRDQVVFIANLFRDII